MTAKKEKSVLPKTKKRIRLTTRDWQMYSVRGRDCAGQRADRLYERISGAAAVWHILSSCESV